MIRIYSCYPRKTHTEFSFGMDGDVYKFRYNHQRHIYSVYKNGTILIENITQSKAESIMEFLSGISMDRLNDHAHDRTSRLFDIQIKEDGPDMAKGTLTYVDPWGQERTREYEGTVKEIMDKISRFMEMCE